MNAVRAADHEQVRAEQMARRQVDNIVAPIQEQHLLPTMATTREPEPVATMFAPETPLPQAPAMPAQYSPTPDPQVNPVQTPALRLTPDPRFDISQR